MPKQVHVATLQLAVVADGQADACDGISEMLARLMAFGPNGEPPFILDWAYLKLGGQLQCPTLHDHISIEGYEEGDFLA